MLNSWLINIKCSLLFIHWYLNSGCHSLGRWLCKKNIIISPSQSSSLSPSCSQWLSSPRWPGRGDAWYRTPNPQYRWHCSCFWPRAGLPFSSILLPRKLHPKLDFWYNSLTPVHHKACPRKVFSLSRVVTSNDNLLQPMSWVISLYKNTKTKAWFHDF